MACTTCRECIQVLFMSSQVSSPEPYLAFVAITAYHVAPASSLCHGIACHVQHNHKQQRCGLSVLGSTNCHLHFTGCQGLSNCCTLRVLCTPKHILVVLGDHLTTLTKCSWLPECRSGCTFRKRLLQLTASCAQWSRTPPTQIV